MHQQRINNKYLCFCNENQIIGKYRFLDAHLDDWPFYTYGYSRDKTHLLLYGINHIEGVGSYGVYPSDDTSLKPIYEGEVETEPFFKAIENEEDESYVGRMFVQYYDENGDEIDLKELWQEAPESAEGETPSVGSAELGMIYVFLAILLILGITFVRFFLRP